MCEKISLFIGSISTTPFNRLYPSRLDVTWPLECVSFAISGSDEKFVAKLHKVFDEDANTKSPYYGRNRKAPKDFIVKHFAGEVTYLSTDFCEKDRDALAVKLLDQMQNSTLPVLKLDLDKMEAPPDGGKGGGKKGKLTLAAKFKLDLDNLMTALRSTCPHFIRCVKPNDFQQPNRFDSPVALNQLKYSGLFEAISIRKSGYAVRLPIEQFNRRYKVCCLTISKEIRQDPVRFCTAIMNDLALRSGFENQSGAPRLWVVGVTKIFLR